MLPVCKHVGVVLHSADIRTLAVDCIVTILVMMGPKTFERTIHLLSLPLFFFPLLQDFLTKLVCNLLEEGNAFFKDRDWEQAVQEFSEGLNVTFYAEAEKLCVPKVLLESLFVNRATAYHSMVSKIDFIVGLC